MQSLYEITTDAKKAAQIVMSNMLKTHPKTNLVYRPFRLHDAIRRTGWMMIDVKKVYPEAKPGDKVWVGFYLDSSADYDAAIFADGKAKVFVNGELAEDRDGRHFFPVKQGKNQVAMLFECESDDDFTVGLIPSTAHYIGMWANDYLLSLKLSSPIADFEDEECVGLSGLIKPDEEVSLQSISYVWPKLEDKNNQLNFDEIFKNSKGYACYALTYALDDTELKMECDGNLCAFVNGVRQKNLDLKLKKGDSVLLKMIKNGDSFGCVAFNDAKIGIPFVDSHRPYGDEWLTIGTFGTRLDAELAYGPEIEIQFTHPYIDSEFEEVFWSFGTERDILRAYVDTFFYAQWFYPNMLAQYGMLRCAKTMVSKEYRDYFLGSLEIMTKYFRLSKYENRKYGYASLLYRTGQMVNLDNIGTIGMNMCEYYNITQSTDALYCLEKMKDAIDEHILRFEDGAFYREPIGKHGHTMWADDMFMSCPLLVRMGHVFNDTSYFDECVKQIKGFHRRLYRPEQGIYSHILYVDDNFPNQVSWSRGNGWIFAATAEVLSLLPKETEGYDEVLKIFTDFAEKLLEYQQEDGLWCQVIDHPDSYSETSGSTMFLLGMSLGVKNGILSAEKYGKCIKDTYIGLIKTKVDSVGNVYGVCRGSGLSRDVEYYKQLLSLTNDDHGTGILLAAFAAYMEIEDII